MGRREGVYLSLGSLGVDGSGLGFEPSPTSRPVPPRRRRSTGRADPQRATGDPDVERDNCHS